MKSFLVNEKIRKKFFNKIEENTLANYSIEREMFMYWKNL